MVAAFLILIWLLENKSTSPHNCSVNDLHIPRATIGPSRAQLALFRQFAMISKRKLPSAEHTSLRRRLNDDITNLVGTNQVSIRRGIALSHNAVAAGAARENATVPPEWRWQRQANLARAYRRWTGRNSQWPKPYWAQIRMTNPKTNKPHTYWIAFLLPHEIVSQIFYLGNVAAICDISNADPITRAFIEEMRIKDQEPHLLGLGLWGGEIPCFWDRSESVAALTLNLPGIGGELHKMRIPLCAINHAYWGPHTWFDVLKAVTWSLRWLDHGHHPQQRHDEHMWHFAGHQYLCDNDREAKAGKPLLGKAILAECRGDWKFFCEAYGMPMWNNGQGICWDCRCTKEEALFCD